MEGSEPPCVVGVVGRSNAGKTTLIERLLPALAELGLRVGAVKHASHGFDADRRGKDSHRLYAAGARAVALVSGDQLATFQRRSGAPRLLEALGALPPGLDLVLVEGFSWEPIPRIVVVPAREAPAAEHVAAGPALGVVEAPAPAGEGPPPFAAVLVASIARELAGHVEAACGARVPVRSEEGH